MRRLVGTILCLALLLAGAARFGRVDCGAACKAKAGATVAAAGSACCCCTPSDDPGTPHAACCCGDVAPQDPEPAPAPGDQQPKVPDLKPGEASARFTVAVDETAPKPPRPDATAVPQAPGRPRQVVLSVFRL